MITYKPGMVLCMQGAGTADNYYLGNCNGSGFVRDDYSVEATACARI